jgi:hypothetical protein
LPNVAFASTVTDWYGLNRSVAKRGVNLFSPRPVVPNRGNGSDKATLCRSANDSTSRAFASGVASLPITRCVSEYSTESRTMGRNGVSTVSKRAISFWFSTSLV